MTRGMYGPDFREKHPKSHLVVVPYDPAKFYNPETEWTRFSLMMGIINRLGLEGEYTGIDKATQGVILLMFAERDDAVRFSAELGAKPVEFGPDWLSASTFYLDEPTYLRLRDEHEARYQRRLEELRERLDSRPGSLDLPPHSTAQS